MKTTLIPTSLLRARSAVERFGNAPIVMLPGSGLSAARHDSATGNEDATGNADATGTAVSKAHFSAVANVRGDGVPPRGRPV